MRDIFLTIEYVWLALQAPAAERTKSAERMSGVMAYTSLPSNTWLFANPTWHKTLIMSAWLTPLVWMVSLVVPKYFGTIVLWGVAVLLGLIVISGGKIILQQRIACLNLQQLVTEFLFFLGSLTAAHLAIKAVQLATISMSVILIVGASFGLVFMGLLFLLAMSRFGNVMARAAWATE